MKKNIDKTHGLVFSQSVLLALIKKGMKREDAYRIVQSHAMNVWQDGKDFRTTLESDPEVKKFLNGKDLDDVFDGTKSVKHVDYVFGRLGLK
jgi:adenylosuccinate lyase